MRSPEHKHDVGLLLVQVCNDRICQLFPASVRVTSCFTASDSQRCIEHQDTLLCPVFKIAVVRDLKIRIVGLDGFVDILQ